MKSTTTKLSEEQYKYIKENTDEYPNITVSSLIAYAVELMMENDKADLQGLNRRLGEKKKENRKSFMGASKFD
jgi:hypothetical protein